MTRVTNFGRKRTYLEAGFENTGEDSATQPDVLDDSKSPKRVNEGLVEGPGLDDGPPKKKKRIRKKKPKSDQTQAVSGKVGDDEGAAKVDGGGHGVDETATEASRPSKKAMKKKKWREMEREKKQHRESSIFVLFMYPVSNHSMVMQGYCRQRYGVKNEYRNERLIQRASLVEKKGMRRRIARTSRVEVRTVL